MAIGLRYLRLGVALVAPLLLVLAGLSARRTQALPSDIVVPSCNPADLIAAIHQANAQIGPDTIVLPSNCTYTLNAVDNSAGTPDANGLPIISSTIIIEGNGSTIQRGNVVARFRIFDVSNYGELTLRNLTVAGGYTPDAIAAITQTAGNGGGIRLVLGKLTLDQVIVRDNQTGASATNLNGGDGGGLYTEQGMVVVTDTVIRNNGTASSGYNVSGSGGGWFDFQGIVTVFNTRVYSNTTGDGQFGDYPPYAGSGGGMYAKRSALAIVSSTIDYNHTGNGGSSATHDGAGGGSGGGLLQEGGALTLTQVTIAYNRTGDGGNGLQNGGGGGSGGGYGGLGNGIASLRDSHVVSNTTGNGGIGQSGGYGGYGGGIGLSRIYLLIERTTIASNVSGAGGAGATTAGFGGQGGGLSGGYVTYDVRQSTISHNRAGSSGVGPNAEGGSGGAVAESHSSVFMQNTTLSGNQAGHGVGTNAGGVGGAIYLNNDTIFVITNVSVISNSSGFDDFASPSGGSGIWSQVSLNNPVTVTNSVFANALNDNCGGSGGIRDAGHNLETGLTCILTATGSISHTPALFGPLAYNGGATQTHLPLPGSPAIDHGDNAVCAFIGNRDQRNFLRPFGAVCDIGAVERGPNLYLPLIER